MRKIYLVLRLFFEAGLSIRAIARSIKASPSTVGDYIRRAKVAGLGWPLPEGMDERALEAKLFPPPKATSIARPLPDWSTVHQELRRKGVTLALLWHEYKTEQPEGMQYSWFCERYRAWSRHLDVVMRQEHRAGEKLFVDYAGHTVPVVNRETGELREAQVFVAVLGASNYTFAEATWTQSLPDWCASHVRALRFFGGATELVVPDNLRAAITQPHRYEPDANPTYQDLAEHYGMAILPARVRRPRDKSKVEVGVQLVERWILAALRHRVFFSLAELNAAISELLHRLNERPFNKLPGSRRSLFESLDQPALKPLPSDAYLYAEWKKVRVHIDYHVEVDRHYYSVPYTLVGKQLHARFSAATVEVFHRGVRVASHVRSHLKGRHTTSAEHMPEKHRRMGQWSPERFIQWAEKTGPATAKLISNVLCARRHPEQSYRSCLGILRLAKTYGDARLETACQRALTLGTYAVRSIESILKHRLDEQPLGETEELALPLDHDNIRGPSYYH
jgi:transposase